jgi:hypothetical protein
MTEFRHHATNTDVRWLWDRAGLTDEDFAIMRAGCVPMMTVEREMLRRDPDREVMDRWTRNCTAIRRTGRTPTLWKIRQLVREM